MASFPILKNINLFISYTIVSRFLKKSSEALIPLAVMSVHSQEGLFLCVCNYMIVSR